MTLVLVIVLLLIFSAGGYSGYRIYGPSSGPYIGGLFGAVAIIVVLYLLLEGGVHRF